MKKLLTLILFSVCSAKFSNAQYYYQPYPLSAQIASNGIEWRMECSVYDSLIGTTQYYNGPWCSDSLAILNDSVGIAAYSTQYVNAKLYNGAVIYDSELHVFKPVANDSCTACGANDYFSLGGNKYTTNHENVIDEDFFNVTTYYYDIKNGNWISTSFYGIFADGGGEGDFSAYFDELWIDGYSHIYALDPVLHSWVDIGSGERPCDYPWINNDADFYYQDGYDCNTSTDYGYFLINHGNSSFYSAYLDGHYYGVEGRNAFYQDYDINPSNNSLLISTGDVTLNSFPAFSIDGINTSSIKKDKNVFSLIDISNTIITYGVYSFPQNAWQVSSDTVNYIASDTIINGTVFFTDSNGSSYTRGYIDSIGWGNYNTPPQPIYCLLSYNTASTGNLVYIKDYSIGADSVFIDYGDGFTTNRTFDYHLYKVNGHYRSTAAANFNVCMTGYQNGVASTPSCQVVNFVTALEEPVKQTPITITSKGNSNILNISNTDGHALQVKVYDIAGRQIKSFNNTSNQLLVSLKTLSTGMYVVQVYDEQTHETVTGKFVKR